MSLTGDILNLIDPNQLGCKTQQIILTSDDLANSTCLFNSLLCQSVKLLKNLPSKEGDKSTKLFMILFNQSYSDYSRHQIKFFGTNLKPLKDTGQLVAIDMLSDYKQVQKEGLVSIDLIIQETLTIIEKGLTQDEPTKAIVLIDDISCLLNLGLSFHQTYQYYRALRNIASYHKIGLIMQSYFDYDEEDTDINRLVYSLVDTSNYWLQSKRLDTGYSSKVDGTLSISDYNGWPTKTSNYHFKKMPRNVRVLPIGAFS